jgi:hypothetical protein
MLDRVTVSSPRSSLVSAAEPMHRSPREKQARQRRAHQIGGAAAQHSKPAQLRNFVLARGNQAAAASPATGFISALTFELEGEPGLFIGSDSKEGLAGLGRAPGTDQRTVQALRRTLAGTAPDELMVTAMIHDHAAHLRSSEITAKV